MTLTTIQMIQFGGRVGRADDAILRVAHAREAALNALSRATNGGTDPDGLAEAKELRGLAELYHSAAIGAGEWLRIVCDEAEKYGLAKEVRESLHCPEPQKDAGWWTVRVQNIGRLVDDVKAAQVVAAEEAEDGIGELFGYPPLANIKPDRNAARARLAEIAKGWDMEVWDSMP